MRMNKLQFVGLSSLLGLTTYGLTIGYSNTEPSFALGLPNGYVLAALLGGLLGLWLSLGGSRRIAAFAGWLIGVFTAWLLWQAGADHVWVIEAVLVATFGLGAAAFTSLVTFMLLFGVMRWAAGIGAKAVAALLSWGIRLEARRVMARAVAAGD